MGSRPGYPFMGHGRACPGYPFIVMAGRVRATYRGTCWNRRPRLGTQFQIHQIMMVASATVARKFRANLSYRVATRRHSSRCEKARSIKFRSR